MNDEILKSKNTLKNTKIFITHNTKKELFDSNK